MSSTSSKLSSWLASPVGEFNRAEALRKVVDPETTPFKSKYEAIGIYTKLLTELEALEATEPSDRLWLLQLALQSEATFLHIDTEDLASAQRCLQAAIDLIREKLKLPFIISSFNSSDETSGVEKCDANTDGKTIPGELSLLFIQLYNLLGFLKSMRSNFQASTAFFKEAERIFYAWEKTDTKLSPLSVNDLFSFDSSALDLPSLAALQKPLLDVEKCELSKAHTMTIYYLAQAYQQMGEYTQSARYCHLTLRLQYRWLGTGELAVDHIEWALNAATLSQYFGANEQYSVARHLMACARKVLNETGEAQKSAEEERWKKAGADLDRIEVKYCLLLLNESFVLLSLDKMKEVPRTEWKFNAFLLNDRTVEEAERQLPAFPVRNYTEAKAVVKHALLAIDSAKGFFTLHERASDYFDCVFDHSAIFGAVVPFEPELENRCKMIKRRIDMLEGLAGELNPTYFLQHCRKIHYELGDIYSQQVSLKYAVHEATFARQQAQLAGGSGGESLDPAIVEKNVQAMRKINLLTVKSIGHYHRFLGTFEVLNPGGAKEAIKNLKVALPFEKIDMYPLPKRIEESAGETESYLQAIVTSYLAVGRLYIKIVTSTPSDRVRYWMTCEKYYKALKTYLLENDDQRREHFEEYEKQLDEMLALIPGKIQQILSQSVC